MGPRDSLGVGAQTHAKGTLTGWLLAAVWHSHWTFLLVPIHAHHYVCRVEQGSLIAQPYNRKDAFVSILFCFGPGIMWRLLGYAGMVVLTKPLVYTHTTKWERGIVLGWANTDGDLFRGIDLESWEVDLVLQAYAFDVASELCASTRRYEHEGNLLWGT